MDHTRRTEELCLYKQLLNQALPRCSIFPTDFQPMVKSYNSHNYCDSSTFKIIVQLFYQVWLNSHHAGKLISKFTATHQSHIPLLEELQYQCLTLLRVLTFLAFRWNPPPPLFFPLQLMQDLDVCRLSRGDTARCVAPRCTFALAECSSLALLSSAEIYVTAVGCACG